VLFADSTLPSSAIIDDLPISSNNEFVEDMFLTLGPGFTEDFEKIKKIACEVQQFCTASSSDNSQDIPKIVIENNKTLQSGCYTLETASDSSEIIIDNINAKSNKQVDLSDMNKQKYCGSKVTKKYKKVIFNNKRINADSFEISVDNKDNNNNSNSNINNNTNDDNNDSNNNKIEKIQFGSTSNNKVKKSLNLSCNTNSNVTNSMGPRKERSLHYCSICSKGFKDKYSVNVHTRTHTGEKPFT
jgi:hypothetical protein